MDEGSCAKPCRPMPSHADNFLLWTRSPRLLIPTRLWGIAMETACASGYTHGWQTCRACHHNGSTVTREIPWHLRANPGYWGASSPEILVLGFSKGANQIEAAERGEFDGVAFARMRDRLRSVLATLGLASKDMDIDAAMRAEGDFFGFASLIRCGMSLEQGGSLVTSGTVMPKALRSPWARAVMDRCIRQHLLDLPASVRTVVLLGSAAAYIEGVKALMATVFSDYRELNEVAFLAAGRPWIFAAHPSPGNGHFASWLNEPDTGQQGRKRTLAISALGSRSLHHRGAERPLISTAAVERVGAPTASPRAKSRIAAPVMIRSTNQEGRVVKINGKDATAILAGLCDRVELHKKDNTDKLWSYKLRSAKRTEFAFDPKTTRVLCVRVDREPPDLPGISGIERISGKDVSTALDRVFSGGIHRANYKATIDSEEALLAFIAHYEALLTPAT